MTCADCVRQHREAHGQTLPKYALGEGVFLCCDGDRRCYVHVGLYRQSVALCSCADDNSAASMLAAEAASL